MPRLHTPALHVWLSLLLGLLLVGSTPCSAAEVPVAAQPQQQAQAPSQAPAALPALPHECPEVREAACEGPCQKVICKALHGFYSATFNPNFTTQWARQRGWAGTAEDCVRAVSSNRHGLPPYCSRYGVECCVVKRHGHQQCRARGAVSGLVLEVNYLNGTVSDPLLLSALVQLHACGLTKLVLQGNDLSGTLSKDWGRLNQLTQLNLANNWVSGTLPSSLQNLKQLRQLALGANFLNGPLPPWLGGLRELRELRLGANLGTNNDSSRGFQGSLHDSLGNLTNLQVLDLQANSLSGPLPQNLCSSSRLEMLQVRNNRLSGPLKALSNCSTLTLLDVSGNRFSGTLPDVSASNWSRLVVLDASYNQLTGPVPSGVYHLPVLTYLSLSHNRLSGSISREVALLTYLTQLQLQHNNLSGALEDGLWTLPQLQYADLSSNGFYGTLSRMTGLSISLQQLSLDNNTLVGGPLPPDLGLLRNLKGISLHNTKLSCVPLRVFTKTPYLYLPNSADDTSRSNSSRPASSAGSVASWHGSSGGIAEVEGNTTLINLQPTYQCTEKELLPCFLTFSEHTVPRTDNTKMACPEIVRLPHGQAVSACSGSAPWQLGVLAEGVAETQTSEQSWELDPEYYQYKRCSCLRGYAPSWSRNNTLLTCTPKSFALPVGTITAIVSGAAGLLLLAAVGLLVWLRLVVQLRPKWQREKELLANRRKGVPCGAPATIVVTDIEHYSALMQVNAQLTTRALGLHNAVMRRAAASHAGNVIEQEGDSWSVVFHTPMDAVAFCLQVQQALSKTHWPGSISSGSLGSSSSSKLPVIQRVSHGSASPQAMSKADSSDAASPAFKHSTTSKGKASSSWSNSSSFSEQQHVFPSSGRQANGSASAPQSPVAAARCQPSLLHLASHRSCLGLGKQGKKLQLPCQAEESITSLRSLGSPQSFHNSSGGFAMASDTAAVAPGQSSSQDQVELDGRTGSVKACVSNCTGMQSMLSCLVGRRPSRGWLNDSHCCADQDSFCTVDGFAEDIPGGDHVVRVIPALRDATSSRSNQVAVDSCVHDHQPTRFWSLFGLDRSTRNDQHSGNRLPPAAMRGLKVRMGVASGFVPADTHICRCALMQLAKAVSDMAHGGQILVDGSSFAGIRDRLTELGTVDARGYNDKLWRAAAKAVMRQHTSGWLSLSSAVSRCYGRGATAVLDSDALALDMGTYFQINLAHVLPHTAVPADTASRAAAAAMTAAAAADVGDAALAAAALTPAAGSSSSSSGGGSGGRQDCSCAELSLYSVCPRSLQARVKVWGSSLSFKEGTQQTSRGYFQAPGTMLAELGTSARDDGVSGGPQPLAPVTMVFAEVEGGRALVRRRPEVAHLVHNTLTRLLQVLLAALPASDGYLCREQECDMRYMVCFRETTTALEWCLLVQEVLLYIPWPEEVLDEFSNTTSCSSTALDAVAALTAPQRGVHSLHTAGSSRCNSAGGCGGGGSGSPCGGPCMLMGMAEGQPHSIMPDHLGRADYHGFHVNLAARLMGASGPGQVATSIETAEHVFSTWRYEAEQESQNNMQASSRPLQQHQQQDVAVAECAYHLSPAGAVSCQNGPSAQQQAAALLQQPAAHLNGDTHHASALPGSHSCPAPSQHASATAGTTGPAAAEMQSTSAKRVGSQPHQQQLQVVPSSASQSPHAAAVLQAAAAGRVSSHQHQHQLPSGLPRRLQSLARPSAEALLGNRGTNLLPDPTYPLRRVRVSAHHLGSFAFKGCGSVEVVTFTADTIPVLAWPKADTKGAKGTLIAEASGPVVGLQDCRALLPAVLPVLHRAWSTAGACMAAGAAAVPAAAGGAVGGGDVSKERGLQWGNAASAVVTKADDGGVKMKEAAGLGVQGVCGGG